MRPSIPLALVLGGALIVAVAVGCRDASPAAPQPTLDEQSGLGGGGQSGDDSTSAPPPPNTHEPATPAAPPDTAVQPPAARPASFTLTGLIFRAQDGSDTTRLVAVSGATAGLYRVKAADGTPVEPEVLVGTAISNHLGEVVFRDLPSAWYRLDARAPAGSQYGNASRTIEPPPAKAIAVLLILRR